MYLGYAQDTNYWARSEIKMGQEEIVYKVGKMLSGIWTGDCDPLHVIDFLLVTLCILQVIIHILSQRLRMEILKDKTTIPNSHAISRKDTIVQI